MPATPTTRFGVDTGGTFTDCVSIERGQVNVLKVFSTPDSPATAILEGLRRLSGERSGRWIPEIIHGTTFGTNSLLERRGARVALVTTAGFEDLNEIGRQARPRLYDLNIRRDPPLVLRPLRWGIKERTVAGGKVLLRPGPGELKRLRALAKRLKPESIAVCFLFSFASPKNERIAARVLRDLGLPVSVSHEVLPEFREYERLSTVVINAYLAPRLGAYLAGLERAVSAGRGPGGPSLARKPGRIYVMQSSGGITTAARAAAEPVRTILSGPAGGVVATAWLAESLGLRCAISFDMGGTSTDVCLLDGQPRTTRESSVGGLPIAIPVLDVHSVGAGGGSIARFDRGGALRVGPESAGSTPGPICYGRGGTRPTVTDANLLLGRLDPDYFLGGTFRLAPEAVEQIFTDFLGGQSRGLGSRAVSFKNALELAQGIVAVSNATMEKALRVISIERGYDPRDFSLVCFGGAGGLHAAELARSLGLAGVIVPRNPGAFSALGVLLSDVVKDVSQSVLLVVPDGGETERQGAPKNQDFRNFLGRLSREFARLERAGRAELRRERFAEKSSVAQRYLEVRYRGQSYELSIPFTAAFPARFRTEHEKAYGYAHPGRPLEIVSLRVRLAIRTSKPPAGPKRAGARPGSAPSPLKQEPVWFNGRFRPTPFYDRERLGAGSRIAGPAVVIEYSSTTVVPPGYECRVDEYLNLVLVCKRRGYFGWSEGRGFNPAAK